MAGTLEEGGEELDTAGVSGDGGDARVGVMMMVMAGLG